MRRLSLACCLLFATVATPAAAQNCVAPPGTAAVEQYCETVPEVDGAGDSGRGDLPQPITPDTARELDRAGSDGQQLSRLLTPSRTGDRRGSRETGAGVPKQMAKAPARPLESANPLSAVRSAVGTGDVMGGRLAWILVLTAVAIGAAAWVRHRRAVD